MLEGRCGDTRSAGRVSVKRRGRHSERLDIASTHRSEIVLGTSAEACEGGEQGDKGSGEVECEVIVVGEDDGVEGIAVFGVGIDQVLAGGVEFVPPSFGA